MSIDTDWRDAEWAYQHGLYTRLVTEAAELDGEIELLAKRLADSSPGAMTKLKEVLWQDTPELEKLLAARAEISGSLVLSEFSRAAIAKLTEAK